MNELSWWFTSDEDSLNLIFFPFLRYSSSSSSSSSTLSSSRVSLTSTPNLRTCCSLTYKIYHNIPYKQTNKHQNKQTNKQTPKQTNKQKPFHRSQEGLKIKDQTMEMEDDC